MTDEDTNNTEQEGEEISTPVEKVNENYEKLKEANDKVEAELLRGETLKAKVALGGKSMAGQTEKPKSEDEKWSEDAKKRYEGTGMDPTDDDTPTTYS